MTDYIVLNQPFWDIKYTVWKKYKEKLFESMCEQRKHSETGDISTHGRRELTQWHQFDKTLRPYGISCICGIGRQDQLESFRLITIMCQRIKWGVYKTVGNLDGTVFQCIRFPWNCWLLVINLHLIILFYLNSWGFDI